MNRLTTLILLTLTTATLAHAQPADSLRPQDRAYASRLGLAFGCADPGLEPIVFLRRSATAHTPTAHTPTAHTPDDVRSSARGLQVSLGALEVYRFKLESAAVALDFAARFDLPGTGPVVGQVCGDQVLFLQGEPLRDAHFAGNALDLAWVTRPAAPSASLARLGAGERIMAAHERTAGAVAARISDLLETARSHPEAATRHAADEVSVRTPDGRTDRARLDAKGGWRWEAASAKRGAALRSYLARVTGYAMDSSSPAAPPVAATARATRGVAGALGGLGR